ncbi:MAG TPA: hypothetical protein VL551_11740 [Actinospica sp.]|jgi:hypothetical protein|nr:hypothetical protein [Actinospica sp.]
MAGRRRSHEAAAARARFLGEAGVSARYAVGTNTTVVIDECSPAQRSVRALLALLALNDEPLEKYPFNHTNASGLVTYSFTLSPRRGALLIVSRAPDNIARRILGAEAGFRFAGEAVTTAGEYIYRLVHVPSGAVVISTEDRGTLAGVRFAMREDVPPFTAQDLGVPVTAREQEMFEYVDGLSSDVRALLAALFVRLSASDRRTWAVGAFFGDPLRRPPAPWWDPNPLRDEHRSLREIGARWELRWTGPPFPGDIVAALTQPVCGLRGASAHGQVDAREREIVFGKARLLLRPN